MAICPNCKANNYDGVYSCVRCGTMLGGGYYPPQKKKSNTALVAIISVLLIAIVAVAAYFAVSANSPEAPVKNAIKALNTGDPSYLENALPEFLLKTEYEYFEDSLELAKKEAEEEYGSGKFKYKVLRKTKLDSDELENARDFAEYLCEINDVATPEITAGYSLRVELVYDGSYGEYSDVKTIDVYKIDGKWRIMPIY